MSLVKVTLAGMTRKTNWQFRFDLNCSPDARLTVGQPFQIVSRGCEPVTGQITTAVNQSDGTSVVHMFSMERDREELLRRLRALPVVSNIVEA